MLLHSMKDSEAVPCLNQTDVPCILYILCASDQFYSGSNAVVCLETVESVRHYQAEYP